MTYPFAGGMAAWVFCALGLAAPAAAQESGMVGTGAPNDIYLEVTTGVDGAPMLSTDEFDLVWGGYYRLNFVCPEEGLDDTTGFHFEAPDLVKNSHIRVVSVGDIEIYLQGMSFNALECDEQGAVRFSFHPMRRGIYDILVRNQAQPPQEAHVQVVVE